MPKDVDRTCSCMNNLRLGPKRARRVFRRLKGSKEVQVSTALEVVILSKKRRSYD